MKRVPLYSRTPERTRAAPGSAPPPQADDELDDPPGLLKRTRARAGAALRRRERWVWLALAVLLAAAAGWPAWTRHERQMPTFEQIDSAMRQSIAKEPLASAAANAYEAVIGSVVRVIGEEPPERPDPKEGEERRSVGTGVVIVDKGLILTNLHVVRGAARIKVTFWNGQQSEATLVNVQPENDLAVLQALTLPDDLEAATMRTTGGLRPGDEVIAVGFPFGIGPSVSQGVVSGLKREFRSPEGKRLLTNLIQFDAAANPGNSGGPLVTMDGNVVGIVTAIMNPTEARTFIGIGFAVPIENAATAAGLPPF
ncbi:MAG TPA: trypsin-like peptidase domain-containing protein [Burkholderiaceae bacterium]|nr:trypsin-like peptidase domain-containing protein [Burkholderiaceae bacterium]HSC00623.1 trypsin-like peptidase domain-containing protein [Burkholderiaceae bacterium]